MQRNTSKSSSTEQLIIALIALAAAFAVLLVADQAQASVDTEFEKNRNEQTVYPLTIKNTLQALPMLYIAHEGSHQASAEKQGFQVEWELDRGWRPAWNLKSNRFVHKTDRRFLLTQGAGFRGSQEIAERMSGTQYERPLRMIVGIDMLLYAAFPKTILNIENNGDVYNLEKYSTGSYTREILIAAGTSHIVRATLKPTWPCGLNYDQHRITGTSLLAVRCRVNF